MTLLSAFKVLLMRYTHQHDIVVGTPIANRRREELEGLIGYFANTLALRTKVEGGMSFKALMGRVKEVALGGYGNQDVPFEKVVERLRPERTMSYSPIFQVMFVMQSGGREEIRVKGLRVEREEVESGTAKYDLTMVVEDGDEGAKAVIEFNTDLFDEERIRRMGEHYQTLLESAIANPDSFVNHLQIIPPRELHQLLSLWNDTSAHYEHEVCIHHLFERTAQQHPNEIAIVDGSTSLSYLELNSRANQLARYLKKMRLHREELVGLCLDRSADLIVGMLAILKAGGAYVPLDSRYPMQRLSYILEDTGARLIVTQEGMQAVLPETRAEMVRLDSEWEEISKEAGDDLGEEVGEGNLAYLIYTSGSTGKPKGVQVSHKSLVNHALSIAREYEIVPNDRVLQFASISFDVAAEEIFPSLISGASVVLRTDAMVADTAAFAQKAQAAGLTVLNLPSTYWQQWVEQMSVSGQQVPATVRLMVVGSERASTNSFLIWQTLGGDSVTTRNAYGPTEATITSMIYDPTINSNNHAGRAYLPIGRPIANTEIFLLDRNLQPVPTGIPGEIYIGGEGLARGYQNQPDLTAEQFIPNPFTDRPGARLYKTGDFGRYLSDGNVEFIGRADNQIKLRGYRIELGEIEAALNSHSSVKEAIAIVREDEPGNARLVAYAVAYPNCVIGAGELSEYLRDRIADYMVPSASVIMDELPRTPNGKVDRRSLPMPEKTRSEREGRFVSPRTPTEEVLASIFADVLELERVGVNDNFFDLGGYSLKAIQVTSRVRQALQTELPLRVFFRTPTVSNVALHIARWQAEQADAEAVERIVTQLERLSEDEARVILEAAMNNNAAINGRVFSQAFSEALE